MCTRLGASAGSSAFGRSESARRFTASFTAGGTAGASDAGPSDVSPRLNAQYPVRAKIVVRGRATRTVTR